MSKLALLANSITGIPSLLRSDSPCWCPAASAAMNTTPPESEPIPGIEVGELDADLYRLFFALLGLRQEGSWAGSTSRASDSRQPLL